MLKSKSRNIILVDDDPVTIQVCNMIFKRTIPFAKILVFENGWEIAEWITEEGIHTKEDHFVMFLDLNMPVHDGWWFLNYFEKLEETIRQKFSIHILTSSVDERDLLRSRQYDCVKGFHSKPLTHKMIDEIFAESAIFHEQK